MCHPGYSKSPWGRVAVPDQATLRVSTLSKLALEAFSLRSYDIKSSVRHGIKRSSARRSELQERTAPYCLHFCREGVKDEHALAEGLADSGSHFDSLQGLETADDSGHCKKRAVSTHEPFAGSGVRANFEGCNTFEIVVTFASLRHGASRCFFSIREQTLQDQNQNNGLLMSSAADNQHTDMYTDGAKTKAQQQPTRRHAMKPTTVPRSQGVAYRLLVPLRLHSAWPPQEELGTCSGSRASPACRGRQRSGPPAQGRPQKLEAAGRQISSLRSQLRKIRSNLSD
jgi:hypothetical protein